MHQILKTSIRTAIDAVPTSLWRRVFPKDVIGLMYHVVSDNDLSHVKYYAYKTAARFEADVIFAREHFPLLSYQELVRRRRGNADTSANGVLFTFDDGFVECFTVARPILRTHGVGAVFFVTTDFIDSRAACFELAVSLCVDAVERLPIDAVAAIAAELVDEELGVNGSRPDSEVRFPVPYPRIRADLSNDHARLIAWLLRRGVEDARSLDRACSRLAVTPAEYVRQQPPYMTTAQLRQLVAEGFIVGAHGVGHRPFQTMTDEAMERDIVESCDHIRQITGQRRVPFAFPYTGYGVSRGFLHSVLQRHDFIELLFDSGGLRTDVPFVVDRVWADPPIGCIADRSNLPALLRDQWSRPEAWSLPAFRIPPL